jgi:hemerythrin-like metal-binding protein
MAFIDWTSELETGIEKIDTQHKKLVSLINELHEAMHKGKGKEAVGHVLEELKQYTKYHFGTEEKAFEKYSYPQAREHKKEHDALIQQLDELVAKQANGDMLISIEVLNFLTTWLKGHILKEDMLYVPLLKGKTIE